MGKGISGTAEECIEQIRDLANAGCDLLVIEFFGRDTREPAQLFAERGAPIVRPPDPPGCSSTAR